MSIISLKKTFENGQLVYFYSNNKIIECTCLSELFNCFEIDYDNEDFGTYICDKVKIITIYDIYKNIIYEPIKTNLFKDPIKIGGILKDLIKISCFFKTFIGAFIKNNKLDGIEYYTNYKGTLHKILYDNILYDNIKLEINDNIKTFNIYDNKGICMYKFKYNKNVNIYYKSYNDLFEYHIYDNNIIIINGQFPFQQIIYCSIKNLKIFKMEQYNKNTETIYEKRNDNNEITYLNEYNKNVLKYHFNSNNTNPPFSKPLRKFCIELIDYYKKNINNYNELTKSCVKKEKEVYNRLLLNYKLEMINSK